MPAPIIATVVMIADSVGLSTFQIAPPIGCHRINMPINNMHVINTKVDRSISTGTNFVHHFLKAGRAITLCWIPKIPRSKALRRIGNFTGKRAGLLMCFGTMSSVTKPRA